MQIFLQYCYSALLNIELHCRKYCKKIIIFYLTLSPLSLISRLCLSSLTLSPLSLISHLCLSITEPSTISRHPQQPPVTQHHRAQPTNSRSMTHDPTRQNQHGDPRPTFAIHDPQSTTRAMRIRACHGANEVLGFIEAELWNLWFFVCGFCWLMRFWLIYEVLGVWVDGLLLDYFTTSLEMKAPAEVTNRRELKMRERREMGEKI